MENGGSKKSGRKAKCGEAKCGKCGELVFVLVGGPSLGKGKDKVD